MSEYKTAKIVYKKYRLTEETKILENGTVLYRIQALRSFGNVKKGDLGGWIEKEKNLSHFENCWAYDNAQIYDNAYLFGNAEVFGDAHVHGNTRVFGVTKYTRIINNAK